MNKLVDKIFVINTKKATDRMLKISNHLKELEINFFRFEAIPTNLLKNIDKSNPKNLDIRNFEGWNINAKSLLETTKLIILESIENDYDKILILEDDAEFVNYSVGMQNLSNFINKYNDWDFIHLNYSSCPHLNFTNFPGVLRLKSGCLCCQAYLVNKNVMEIYLNYLNNYEMPIDHITQKLHKERKKSFVITPKLVNHYPGNYSTIRERIVDY